MLHNSQPFKGERILICHFRVGKTDGVSLQISAWKEILEKAGAQVKLCGGNQSVGADYVLNHFENQLDPDVFRIDQAAFDSDGIFKDERDFQHQFENITRAIETDFKKAVNDFHPSVIVISNVFSVGENLPAAKAILSVLDQLKIPTLLVHHDFYWENTRYRQPKFAFIENHLNEFFPPKRSFLKHACINSIARMELLGKKGINATFSMTVLILTWSSRINTRPAQNSCASLAFNPTI